VVFSNAMNSAVGFIDAMFGDDSEKVIVNGHGQIITGDEVDPEWDQSSMPCATHLMAHGHGVPEGMNFYATANGTVKPEKVLELLVKANDGLDEETHLKPLTRGDKYVHITVHGACDALRKGVWETDFDKELGAASQMLTSFDAVVKASSLKTAAPDDTPTAEQQERLSRLAKMGELLHRFRELQSAEVQSNVLTDFAQAIKAGIASQEAKDKDGGRGLLEDLLGVNGGENVTPRKRQRSDDAQDGSVGEDEAKSGHKGRGSKGGAKSAGRSEGRSDDETQRTNLQQRNVTMEMEEGEESETQQFELGDLRMAVGKKARKAMTDAMTAIVKQSCTRTGAQFENPTEERIIGLRRTIERTETILKSSEPVMGLLGLIYGQVVRHAQWMAYPLLLGNTPEYAMDGKTALGADIQLEERAQAFDEFDNGIDEIATTEAMAFCRELDSREGIDAEGAYRPKGSGNDTESATRFHVKSLAAKGAMATERTVVNYIGKLNFDLVTKLKKATKDAAAKRPKAAAVVAKGAAGGSSSQGSNAAVDKVNAELEKLKRDLEKMTDMKKTAVRDKEQAQTKAKEAERKAENASRGDYNYGGGHGEGYRGNNPRGGR
jgi:hypothetical protein